MKLTRRPPASPEEARLMDEKIRMTEVTISLVLRIGVTVSAVIFIIGLVVMFVHHPSYSAGASYHLLTSRSASFPHSFSALMTSLAHGRGDGIILLGTMLLILTPVLRVAVAIVSFTIEKDPAMTLVTIFVLLVLVLSFVLSGA